MSRRMRWPQWLALAWAANLVSVHLAELRFVAYILSLGVLGFFTVQTLWHRFPQGRKWYFWGFGLAFMGLSIVFSPWRARALGWTLLVVLLPLAFWVALQFWSLPEGFWGPPLALALGLILLDSLRVWAGRIWIWVRADMWPFQALPFAAQGLGYTPEETAYVLALSLPLLMAWGNALHADRLHRAWLARIMVGLALWGLAWSRSLPVLLASFGAWTLAFIVSPNWRRDVRAFFHPRLFWMAFGVVLVGVFVFQMQRPADPAFPSLEWPTRYQVWKQALRLGKERLFWGYGPGTWPVLLLKQRSIPPQMPVDNPGNLFVDALVSLGVPGLLWVLVLTWIVLRLGLQGLRGDTTIQRAAGAGALFWLVYQGIGESVTWAGWNILLATLIVLAQRPEREAFHTRSRPRLWSRGVVGVLAGALLLHGLGLLCYEVGWWMARGYRWQMAARWMGVAAWITPWKPGYGLATAYAYARASLQTRDPEVHRSRLQQAVRWYQRSLSREGDYAPHWANLAWVWWLLESRNNAEWALQEAQRRAPEAPFAYALAWIQTRRGYTDSAYLIYQAHLRQYPWHSLSPFMVRDPIRQKALRTWKETGQPAWWFIWGEPLYQALLTAQPQAIQQVLEAYGPTMPPMVRQYALVARDALMGHDGRAQLLGSLPPVWPDLHLWLQARLIAQKQPAQARALLRPALLQIVTPSSFGEGWRLGEAAYQTLYRQLPPPRSDLMPGFPWPVSPVLEESRKWLRELSRD